MATHPQGIMPPKWLTGKIARDYYRSRYRELPPLDSGQRELLAKASAEHESYVTAEAEIARYIEQHKTIFVTGSNGALTAHPATRLKQQAGEALRKFETQLRISLKNSSLADPSANELDKYFDKGE